MTDSHPLILRRLFSPMTTILRHLPIPTFGSRTTSLVIGWLIFILLVTNLIYGLTIYTVLKHELQSTDVIVQYDMER